MVWFRPIILMSRYERPLPPQNLELKHAIEEMAEYIVKYGPKGEEKAMAEHANNPKYAFLFGGPNSDYYQYCLQVNFDRGPPPVDNFAQVQQPNHNLNQQELDEIQALTTQLEDMQRQIAQSEMNLKAQEESIPKQKDHEFAKQVTVAEDAKLSGYLINAKLDIANFFELLNNLNNPKAMKEYIGTCKKWILDNCQTDQQREVILMYLLGRVRNIQSTDSFRLNILYLVNDWAHYCQKKKIDAVTQMLSRYVPKMYAFTVELASDPLVHPKLEKLIGVWEGSKYFTDQCFKQLRNPNHIYTTAMTAITAEYSKIAIDLDMQFQAMFAGYEQQHLNFVRHINQQISQLEGRLMHIRNGNQGQFQAPQSVQRRSRFDQQTRDDMGGGNGFGRFFPPSQRGPPPQDHSWRTEAEGDDIDGVPYNEESLIPNRPYYNLPAALIVPQVPMENLTYKAIEPTNLRMPAIMHPSQRLLDAIEAFYDRPHSMDSHGWEVGSLADFYDRKLRLKKIIEEKLQGEEKTLEDIIDNRMNAEDIKLQGAEKDAQIAKMKEDAKNRANNRRRNSQSRSRSRSRSRSHSRSSRSRSRSRSSSRSRSRSRSRSSRSRSKSVTPPRRAFIRERSPSPVGFGRPSFSLPSAPLGGENKGAMLMAKMGWSGKGLGAKEHGIVEPVSGGEVRDRGEMYRGLGSKADPFEQFRKMRSGNYHDKHQMSAEGRKNQY